MLGFCPQVSSLPKNTTNNRKFLRFCEQYFRQFCHRYAHEDLVTHAPPCAQLGSLESPLSLECLVLPVGVPSPTTSLCSHVDSMVTFSRWLWERGCCATTKMVIRGSELSKPCWQGCVMAWFCVSCKTILDWMALTSVLCVKLRQYQTVCLPILAVPKFCTATFCLCALVQQAAIFETKVNVF